MRPFVALAFALTLTATTSGRAAAPTQSDTRAVYTEGGDLVRLTTTWGKTSGATLRVGTAKPIKLHDGGAIGTLVTGHDLVVIALAVDDADAPFQIQVLDHGKPGKPTEVARPVDRHDLPFAVAATATPDGFTVFFQEVQADDPSAAHTYLMTLDDTGAPVGTPTEIPVPWSLAAAVWNGDGYHLALLYTMDARGMRLSMVGLSAAGQPLQHPDWASRAGFIADVHLVAEDGAIHAFYRGGSNGDRLLDSDVTKIGNWGSEPAKAKDRGALPWSKVIAIKSTGAPTKVAGVK